MIATIVGEAPPKFGLKPFAPETKSYGALRKYLGRDPHEVAYCRNLYAVPLPRKSDESGCEWDRTDARRVAEGVRFTTPWVLFCGHRVANAFGFRTEFLEVTEKDGIKYAVIPHTSGLLHWWEFAENREAALSFFRRVFGATERKEAPLTQTKETQMTEQKPKHELKAHGPDGTLIPFFVGDKGLSRLEFFLKYEGHVDAVRAKTGFHFRVHRRNVRLTARQEFNRLTHGEKREYVGLGRLILGEPRAITTPANGSWDDFTDGNIEVKGYRAEADATERPSRDLPVETQGYSEATVCQFRFGNGTVVVANTRAELITKLGEMVLSGKLRIAG